MYRLEAVKSGIIRQTNRYPENNIGKCSAVPAENVIASLALFARRGNPDFLHSRSPRPSASQPRDDEFVFLVGAAGQCLTILKIISWQ